MERLANYWSPSPVIQHSHCSDPRFHGVNIYTDNMTSTLSTTEVQDLFRLNWCHCIIAWRQAIILRKGNETAAKKI